MFLLAVAFAVTFTTLYSFYLLKLYQTFQKSSSIKVKIAGLLLHGSILSFWIYAVYLYIISYMHSLN